MTVSNYLKRNPNARGSTIAWIAKRDEKVEQLRREIKISRRYKFPSIVGVFISAFRYWRG